MSDQKKKKKAPYQNWLVPGVIGLVFLVAAGFILKIVLTDVAPRSKEQIRTVTLLKPPEVKEKPPEPEVPKEAPKQEVVQDIPQPQDTPQNNDSQDDTPAGSDLGVEGDGSAGGDSFGLQAKKHGRDITLGGGGAGGGMNRLSLLAKYGWYTAKIQEAIKKQVKKRLDQEGGTPKGKFQTLVKIVLDAKGEVIDFKIVGSSGNSRMDKAVEATLGEIRISEPPPAGMPSGMTLKISSQG